MKACNTFKVLVLQYSKRNIDITNNIVFSAATFESRSEVYDGNVKMMTSRQSTD